MHHGEKKVVKKMLKAGLWDEGKRLKLPDLPDSGVTPKQRERLAIHFAAKHGLSSHEGVVKMMIAMQASEQERKDNESEIHRQSEHKLRYGDFVQLLHVETGSMVPHKP